ncbi:MAG: [Fe-Fe] hydrogenase large subunit C-terminal domain-containing protein [Bacillota bacterium]
MELIRTQANDCENCYKCIRTCPVKAISFKDNQAQIITEDCIYCGLCKNACPQDAKAIYSDLAYVKEWLQEGHEVVVSLAPSFLSDFYKSDFNSMKAALKSLGVRAVHQTAEAATTVKRRYEETIARKDQKVLISSACPTVTLLIQKHHPALIPYLSTTPSPMHLHAKMIEDTHPDALKVFIGPCLSKKYEAEVEGTMDAVLSFVELRAWLEEESVDFEKKTKDNPRGKTNAFPVSGGIIQSFNRYEADTHYLSVDGIESCKAALKDIEEGVIDHAFIEMSACENSCTGGPLRNLNTRKPLKSVINIKQNLSEEDYPVTAMYESCVLKYKDLHHYEEVPDEDAIHEILKKMGKDDPSKVLNCGSCGYETCEAKAIAVYQGKADLTMCLPYLKEKAESFSDHIIEHTPNGIMVFDADLVVKTMNPSAKAFLDAGGFKIGKDHVHALLEPSPYFRMLEIDRHKHHRIVHLKEADRTIDETVVYDPNFGVFISILRDITQEIARKRQKEKAARRTIAITDDVIDKQMRVVHEIASLLGETTAETKTALSELKKVIDDE